MKTSSLLLFLLATFASCASIPGQRPGGNCLLDQLQAENRLMKRNSELALRENEVLKTENARYRSEASNQKRKLERFRNDLDALNMKYTEEMNRANEAYTLLGQQFSSFQQESDGKIRRMTEANDLLEQRISEQEARLTVVQRESETKDRALASFEKAGDESRNRIAILETAAGEQKELIRQREADLQEAMRQLEQVQKEMADKQAAIDRLTEKLNALQGTRGQADGEINTGHVNDTPDGR